MEKKENENVIDPRYSAEILKLIEQEMANDSSNMWPSTVTDLFNIIKLEFKKQNISDAKVILETAFSIVDYLGGMQVYLPKGDRLRTYIRDMEIYLRFNGRNIRELARHYKQTEQNIYRILAKQKKLHEK